MKNAGNRQLICDDLLKSVGEFANSSLLIVQALIYKKANVQQFMAAGSPALHYKSSPDEISGSGLFVSIRLINRVGSIDLGKTICDDLLKSAGEFINSCPLIAQIHAEVFRRK